MLIPEEMPLKGEIGILCNMFLLLRSCRMWTLYRRCLIIQYSFKVPLGLQSCVRLNRHSNVIVLILCQNRGSCNITSKRMLEQEHLSMHCAPKYHGSVRNLLDFLLYCQFRQYSYLLKY